MAYVKVREKDDKLATTFLPGVTNPISSSSEMIKNGIESEAKMELEGPVASGMSSSAENGRIEPIPKPGKWYYVSDTQVSEVQEAKVLSAEAYLLFYERFF